MKGNRAELLFLAGVAVHVWLAVENATTTPVLIDEFAHVPAGVSYWDMGRFSLYREDPPLVRLLTTLPVYLSGSNTNYQRALTSARSEWNVGLDFIKANGPRSATIFFRARLVVIALAIFCAALIFWWTREIYGDAAAVVSSALWLLDPNVLAFSAAATVDIGAAAFGCLATYTYWRFLRGPSWTKTLACGLTLGLAQASKFSMLGLYPAVFLLAIAARNAIVPSPGRFVAKLIVIFIVSLLTLNFVYQFSGSFRPLGSYSFKSELLSSRQTSNIQSAPHGNRFRGTALASVPLPLPKDYILGFDSQWWEGEIGLKNLSHGRLVQGGHWYSPLVTLMFKLPLGTLVLVLTSAVLVLLNGRGYQAAEATAGVCALALIGLICSQTGFNWPIRYLLPAFALLLVAVGRLAQVASRSRLWRWALAGCLAWNIGQLLIVHPCYLSYGNELVGGIRGAQQVFIGSNFDWGQDLVRLKKWSDDHPLLKPIVVTYYGVLDAEDVGLPNRGLPGQFWRGAESAQPLVTDLPREPFYWAISSNVLNGLPCWMKLETGAGFEGTIHSPFLKPENAIARIGSSIYMFKIIPPSMESPMGPHLSLGDVLNSLCEYEASDTEINGTP